MFLYHLIKSISLLDVAIYCLNLLKCTVSYDKKTVYYFRSTRFKTKEPLDLNLEALINIVLNYLALTARDVFLCSYEHSPK